MRILAFAIAMILGLGAAGAAPQGTSTVPLARPDDGRVVVAQACGWYVVSGCSKSWDGANKRANKIGAWVVNTSDGAYPNFRPGWFCAVFGPYNVKSTANSKRRYFKGAYVKNAC